MKYTDIHPIPSARYDIVICGGGVAGLWLLNVLTAEGFGVLLVEKESTGGTQTIASQGMIHGGQRYLLSANPSAHADIVASAPARWNACLEGRGELDLRQVRILSETQLMWPIGGQLSHLALNAAKHTLKAKMRKISVDTVPKALVGSIGGTIYELPEKVLDIASLVDVLSAPHIVRILKGRVDALTRDGNINISGHSIRAQAIICAAGLGNEELLLSLEAGKQRSQRRPIRQVMVKPMPFPLYGHGVSSSFKPRITVTSHPLPSGDYVWYLGGALADDVLSFSDDEAISFAKREMASLFVNLEWAGKLWSVWDGVRAEAYCPTGRLPNGPVIQEYDNVLVVWPTKLTLTPLLGDQLLARLARKGTRPKYSCPTSLPVNLTSPPAATVPWEQARWTT
jgi:glycine/D-amino acid oxidase-like deaminating enzyme